MDHWPLFVLLAQAAELTSRAAEIREPLLSPEAIWSIGASLFAVWLIAVGASVGSFLNVVVYRVPAGLNLISPGSRCPRCLHPIRARHNVPIFGWLALGGRCADCQLPISTRYPLVELLVGMLFLIVGGVELIGNGVNLPRRQESAFGGALDDSNSPQPTMRAALTTKEPWTLGVTVTLHLALLATLIAAALISGMTNVVTMKIDNSATYYRGLGITERAVHGIGHNESSDGKTGISGAGKKPSATNHFPERNESVTPYRVASHQHVYETVASLEAVAGEKVGITFVPHLVPLTRGIIVTSYATLRHEVSAAEVQAVYEQQFAGEPFVRVLPPGLTPGPKAVAGSNICDVSVIVDAENGRLVMVGSIDNLMKGQAGVALQNINLMFGFPETTGLDRSPIYP